jgi:hypothetical protein
MDRRTRTFFATGLLVALVIAGVVAGFASSDPDGLERVATDQGFAEEAADHAAEDSPLADYGVTGVENERVSTGLAGIIGVAVTLAAVTGLLYVVRRLRRTEPPAG